MEGARNARNFWQSFAQKKIRKDVKKFLEENLKKIAGCILWSQLLKGSVTEYGGKPEVPEEAHKKPAIKKNMGFNKMFTS